MYVFINMHVCIHTKMYMKRKNSQRQTNDDNGTHVIGADPHFIYIYIDAQLMWHHIVGRGML